MAREEVSLELKLFQKLSNKVLGKKTKEEDDIRRELIKLARKQDITSIIIESGKEDIQKLAENNKDIASLIPTLNSKDRAGRIEKLKYGEELGSKDATKLVGDLEKIENSLNDIGLSFDVQFSKIVDNLGSFINDNRIDIGSRRDALENLVKASKSEGLKSDSLKKIEDLMSENVNLSKDQLDTLAPLLEQAALDANKQGIKTRGTLEEISRKFGGLLNGNKDVKNLLESQTSTGDTIKELLKKSGLPKSTVAQGAFSSLLSFAGLGGLETILGDVFDLGKGGFKLGKGIFKGAGKLGSLGAKGIGKLGGLLGLGGGAAALSLPSTGGIGALADVAGASTSTASSAAVGGTGLLSKAGKFGGKILGGAGKVLGKVALPLAAAASAFEFYQGYNDADKIAGLKPGQKASIGTKVKAGTASALSGLTFGAVSSETAYQGIQKSYDLLFGKEGLFTKLGDFISKITDFDPLGGAVKSVKSFFGYSDDKSTGIKSSTSNIRAPVFGQPTDLSTQATVISSNNASTSRAAAERSSQPPAPIIVNQPAPAKNSGSGSMRVNAIDNHGLQLTQLGDIQ